GPPPGLPADLEHVPRPLHPRVRNSQVGRRSGATQPLRPGFSACAGAQDRPADVAFREPALQAVVRQGDLSGPGATPGHGVPSSRTLCGGVLCAKAQSRLKERVAQTFSPPPPRTLSLAVTPHRDAILRPGRQAAPASARLVGAGTASA